MDLFGSTLTKYNLDLPLQFQFSGASYLLRNILDIYFEALATIMTDRTAEFIQVCNGMQHIKRESSARPPPTPREGAEFTAAASEISKYVHVTSKRLEQLTKCTHECFSVR